jgi:hypothetical protein
VALTMPSIIVDLLTRWWRGLFAMAAMVFDFVISSSPG